MSRSLAGLLVRAGSIVLVVVLALVVAYRVSARAGSVLRSLVPWSAPAPVASAEREQLMRADAAVVEAGVRTASAISKANGAVARSRRAVARARAVHQQVRILSPTTLAVQVTPDSVASVVEVPAPVVLRLGVDSGAAVALERALSAEQKVIMAQEARITVDSTARVAAAAVVAAVERDQHARCGWKCGVVLGVGSVVAVAVGAAHLR